MRARQEDQLQEAVAQWLDLWGVLWHHSPNEGQRSKRTGAKLKRHGLKRGVPDVMIFEPWALGDFSPNGKEMVTHGHGLAIELKSATGRLTRDQDRWLVMLADRGWSTHVCRSLESVMAVCRILRPHHGRWMP